MLFRSEQGGNHKDRFVVLVRDYNDGDTDIAGVAIAGSFNLPLAPGEGHRIITIVRRTYRRYCSAYSGTSTPTWSV